MAQDTGSPLDIRQGEEWLAHRDVYLRTTSLVDAQVALRLGRATIRRLPRTEAERLADAIAKRNVFARHRGLRSFYVQRALGLADQTVIEVTVGDRRRDAAATGAAAADILERYALACSVFTKRRQAFLRTTGPWPYRRHEHDLLVSGDLKSLRSRQRRPPAFRPMPIDEKFLRAFARYGFAHVQAAPHRGGGRMVMRAHTALSWLVESRFERSDRSATVKTAIGLEALLILSDSEPLSRCLSERLAFLLSEDPDQRRVIAKVVKTFYNLRSGIVHGGRPSASASVGFADAMDRLLTLACLVVLRNRAVLQSDDALRTWVECKRWGKAAVDLERPFHRGGLTNALRITGIE